jgi:hypothetical protein
MAAGRGWPGVAWLFINRYILPKLFGSSSAFRALHASSMACKRARFASSSIPASSMASLMRSLRLARFSLSLSRSPAQPHFPSNMTLSKRRLRNFSDSCRISWPMRIVMQLSSYASWRETSCFRVEIRRISSLIWRGFFAANHQVQARR